MMGAMPYQFMLLLVLSLNLQVTHGQQRPGRIPCGTTTADQQVCDLLSQSASRKSMKLPFRSECVWDATNSHCDFGRCGANRVCIGGLGDSCVDADGEADDSFCSGNLSCSPEHLLCGAIGASCSHTGAFLDSREANHLACASGYCDPYTLKCSSHVHNPRPDLSDSTAPSTSDVETEIAKASCPVGFTVCPVPNEDEGFSLSCFDTTSSISQCGGCTYLATRDSEQGRDCRAAPGVGSVACIDSTCRIFSCDEGYDWDRHSKTCVRRRGW
ncbi:hypothetical protein T439DRAFT_282484 [Meredithblackwellia eburnea MCA 4105]